MAADDLWQAYGDLVGTAPAAPPAPSLLVTLGLPNPDAAPASPAVPEDDTIERCGCFDTVRGQRSARGFRVRVKDRFYSCQYLGFIRTGEQSGWDADLGKEVLYVIFHWGTLVVTGKGLATLDDLLNEHRLARLSLGDGKHAVRIDDIRIVPRGAVVAVPGRRAKGA